jgi:hypothetical protein
MNQSFSTNCEAVTHDSDIRKLSFVLRDSRTGAETPIDVMQVFEGLPPNAELLPLYFTGEIGDFRPPPVFTRPYEIRNRNKASFNFNFVKPPPTQVPQFLPAITNGEPTQIDIEWEIEGAVDWGSGMDGTVFVGSPSFLNMPSNPDTYLTGIMLDVTEAFAGPGLASINAAIIDPTMIAGDTMLRFWNSGELQSISVYPAPGDTRRLCSGQELKWRITSNGCNLDDLTAGKFSLILSFATIAPNAETFANTNFSSGTAPMSIPGAIPNGAIITRVRAQVYDRLGGGGVWTVTPTISGVDLPAFDPSNVLYEMAPIYDSGLLAIAYDGNPGTLQLNGTDPATSAMSIQFSFEWTELLPVPFEWTEGDQIAILAFASLDDNQYVPISMARHDYSNTPFVDIVKFDAFNIPDDFDPGTSLAALYPPIDHVAFQNSLMLFMTDFDNASTWNYIRFLVAWLPTESSGNGDVALEITANAREL